MVMQLSKCASGADEDMYDFFLLDVEVMMCPMTNTPSLIIAFDLLSEQLIALSKENSSNSNASDPILEHMALVKSIVDTVQIKGLIAKPIYPATHALELWESRETIFPYPINGLVFLKRKAANNIYKWKPSDEITFRVALYNAKDGNKFLPMIGPENYSLSYSPFYRFVSAGQFEYSHSKGLRSTDFWTKRIRYEVDENNVATAFGPSFSTRDCTEAELQDAHQLVEVPSEYACWAVYQIVEVKLNVWTGTMTFHRLRRDKKKPNNIDEIDELSKMSIQPTSLSYISEKLKNQTADCFSSEEEAARQDFEIPAFQGLELNGSHRTTHQHKQHLRQYNKSLIPCIVQELNTEILSYLAMDDLVPLRRVSNFWRVSIDSTNRDISSENGRWMKKNNRRYGQAFLNTLSLPSIGCFLRFGGRLK
jgi:hypothetical protein